MHEHIKKATDPKHEAEQCDSTLQVLSPGYLVVKSQM